MPLHKCVCVCVCVQHVSLTRELGEKLRDGVHVVLEWGCFSLEHPHVAVQPPAPPATNQTTDPTLHCALFVVVRVKKKHLEKHTVCTLKPLNKRHTRDIIIRGVPNTDSK